MQDENEPDDPYLWLEDLDSDRALGWVRARNEVATAELEAIPGFAERRHRALSILDSKDKIPYVTKRGNYYYNFWRDAENPRGVWRRTSPAEYLEQNPKWEVVLDLDALGRAEGESWVWGGSECLYPKYERCMVSLSRGGADAAVVREFDTVEKQFVNDGFRLPEGKTRVQWKDSDTLYVGTDFGPGSLTESGYPRVAKEWKRGTPLAEAETIFEGEESYVSCGATRQWDHGKPRDLAYCGLTFYTNRIYRRTSNGFVEVPKPASAELRFWDDQVLITLRDDWEVGGKKWPAGSLLAADETAYLEGGREFVALFTPTETTSLDGYATLRTKILVNELDDVKDRLYQWERVNEKWTRTPVETPPAASLGAWAVDEHTSDDYWLDHSGFVTPMTLELRQGNGKRQVMKRAPALFDAEGLQVTQHFARSKDGTRVPYFQISREDLTLDGNNPTLMTGYGGFEISLTPRYSAVVGAAWLERGGVYVVPNIRGGGEYGPLWHQAAIKGNRQRAYDDFAAVAEDVILRKVTRPKKPGIMGSSNGGLLVGVLMTQRPDLFGAVVCKVPLLDMRRYHKLLAGASWMGEYGDPDDAADWLALSRYSPYHNVKRGVDYPRVLFTTSTRDDRVHPGHARKMVAKMMEQGHDVLYYENIEGGHGGAADNEQAAYLWTLSYEFLARELGLTP